MDKKLIAFLITALLCSCIAKRSYQETPAISKATATPTITSTNTIFQSDTPVLSPSATPVPFMNISSLPPGDYLVDFTDFISASTNEEYIYLDIYSQSGEFIGHVAKVTTTRAHLSPDLKYLIEIPYIIDLISGEKMLVEVLNNCTQANWSPDGQYLVAACPVDDAFSQNPMDDISDLSDHPNIVDSLFVFSLEDRSILRITNNSYPITLGVPAWSPDGRWIAYLENITLDGTSNRNGLRILDTICFSSPATCWQDQETDFVTGPLTWSPDSHFVAGIYDQYVDTSFFYEIRIFQVDDGIAVLSQKFPMVSTISLISWSPDGKQIAISTRDGNFLLMMESGELTPLNMQTFYDWISIP
jgi:hypothetical protein